MLSSLPIKQNRPFRVLYFYQHNSACWLKYKLYIAKNIVVDIWFLSTVPLKFSAKEIKANI